MPQLAQAPGQIRTLLRVLRQSLKQLREETIRCKGVTHNAHSPGFAFGVVSRSGTIGRQDLNTCGSFVDSRTVIGITQTGNTPDDERKQEYWKPAPIFFRHFTGSDERFAV